MIDSIPKRLPHAIVAANFSRLIIEQLREQVLLSFELPLQRHLIGTLNGWKCLQLILLRL